MEKIKNFSEFVNSETLNEKTSMKENYDMLYEMAAIGNINSNLCIYVRMNDPGKIPHFHIVDQSTLGKVFHTCVKIKVAEYFHHTGKEGVLNSIQRKDLIKFLKGKDKWGESNWKVLIKEWDRNNSDVEIDINTPMPDYTKLI